MPDALWAELATVTHLDAWQPQALGSSTPSAPRSSWASLATGRYPHSHGVMGLTHGGFDGDLHSGERHAAARPAACGYETHLFGLRHVTQNAVDGEDVGSPAGRADCLTALLPGPPGAPQHAARERWRHSLMLGEQPTV